MKQGLPSTVLDEEFMIDLPKYEEPPITTHSISQDSGMVIHKLKYFVQFSSIDHITWLRYPWSLKPQYFQGGWVTEAIYVTKLENRTLEVLR